MIVKNIFKVGSAFIFDNASCVYLCNCNNISPIVDSFFICRLHCKNPSIIEKIDSGGNVNK